LGMVKGWNSRTDTSHETASGEIWNSHFLKYPKLQFGVYHLKDGLASFNSFAGN
jgi:hypothetical protein